MKEVGLKVECRLGTAEKANMEPCEAWESMLARWGRDASEKP